jgi:tetratricopeptide (TPR) repeat protein
MLILLLACSPTPAPKPPDACAIMATPAPGPLSQERDKAGPDALAQARLRIREARISGDPGFYTLAETALDCALSRTPDDAEAKRLRVHLLVQFHRFAEAEVAAKSLQEGPRVDAHFLDYALYGDALMEQGKLDAAGDAYQTAVNLRPGLEMYDRIGWLRWLWGDVEGSIEMQSLAVSAGSALDPEPLAWVLSRMGWLHAITLKPSPEIDQALVQVPDYPPALFARGRIRLAAGDLTGAREDFEKVGPTVEATWARAEAEDVTANVAFVGAAVGASVGASVGAQDPRGYAIWLSDSAVVADRARAVQLLEAEVERRQDAVTRMALAYARFMAGGSAPGVLSTEVRAVLATGIVEPRVLLQAGLILGDGAPVSEDARKLLERALASGPGLLPSEQKRARDALAKRPVP